MQNAKQGVDFISLNTQTHTHTLHAYDSSCAIQSYQQWNWLSHLVESYQLLETLSLEMTFHYFHRSILLGTWHCLRTPRKNTISLTVSPCFIRHVTLWNKMNVFGVRIYRFKLTFTYLNSRNR